MIAKWREQLNLPDGIRRLVVDLVVGKPAYIYYECFGGPELLEIEPPAGALVINVAEDEE